MGPMIRQFQGPVSRFCKGRVPEVGEALRNTFGVEKLEEEHA